MSVSVCAENCNVTPNPSYIEDGGISARDFEKPNKTWDLSSKDKYGFSGQSSDGRDLYTGYNFTGVSSISLHVENKKSTTLTFKIYKNVPLFPDVLMDTYTVAGNSSMDIDRGTRQSDEKYYIVFEADCDISGYIEKF